MKTKLIIEGMACSACSASVEKVVGKLTGVKSASVNLVSKILICDYDEKIISQDEIIKAVAKIGFSATLLVEEKSKSNKIDVNTKKTSYNLKTKLIISALITIILMYFSMGSMVGLPQPTFFVGQTNAAILMLFLMILTIPVMLINKRFFISGTKAVINRHPNMDTLVSLGASASFIYGIFSLFMVMRGISTNNSGLINQYSSNLYFDSTAMILTLISIGKYLEEKSKTKTNGAVEKLKKLSPDFAYVLIDGVRVKKSIEDIQVEDIVEIRAGEGIPVDGIIIEGATSINESALTGESMPKYKTVGDSVLSATINLDGYIKVKVNKNNKDTVLAQIIDLMLTTGATKAPIARLADKVSSIFVPIVTSISLIVLILWLCIGFSFDFALSNAISVLVISCPCALGLATPVAIMVSTGKCAKNGILIKSAETLEQLKDVTTFAFDKTGTITKGTPKVTNIYALVEEIDLLKIASSIESGSKHPLSLAVEEYAIEKNVKKLEIKDFESITGKGIKAKISNQLYFGGNASYLLENGIDLARVKDKVEEYQKEGKTILYFSDSKELLGIIAVADTIKETSAKAIKLLKDAGKKVVMLSGDSTSVANAVGTMIGIDKVYAEILPEDKSDIIAQLKQQGEKVAFVGDGINDSPALAMSDVGIAIGGGSDIAIDAAQIVLMNNNLIDVPKAVYFSSKTVINIKENLFWAFLYNVICIPIAAGCLYPLGILLNPMIGAACMSLSSIFVVLNALRLNIKTKKEKELS